MIMPKRLITLMVTPKKLASTNMPAKATGMLSATQNARRMFRNMARKSTTSRKPCTPLVASMSMRCRNAIVASLIRSACTASPRSLKRSM